MYKSVSVDEDGDLTFVAVFIEIINFPAVRMALLLRLSFASLSESYLKVS